MDHDLAPSAPVASAAAGGGLLLGWTLEAQRAASGRSAGQGEPAGVRAERVHPHRQGRPRDPVMCQVEMGQGTYTSMPMLLAEELEVGLDQVDARARAARRQAVREPGASAIRRPAPRPRCACSTSRCAAPGATARTMLVAAAAAGVERRAGVVPGGAGRRHPRAHRPHARLRRAGRRARRSCRCRSRCALKDPKDFKLIGTPAKRLDTPGKVNGTAQYGIDVRLPGNEDRHGRREPGGRAARSPPSTTAKRRRSRACARSSASTTRSRSWPTTCGRRSRVWRRSTIRWDDGPNGSSSTADVVPGPRGGCRRQPGVVVRNEGDAASAFAARAEQARGGLRGARSSRTRRWSR